MHDNEDESSVDNDGESLLVMLVMAVMMINDKDNIFSSSES